MAGQQPTFFVDTSILIAHLRQKNFPTIYDRAGTLYGEAIASDMLIYELEIGARRAGRSFEFRKHFPTLQTYPIIEAILLEGAAIQASLLVQNLAIGIGDIFIAATAIHHNLPLLTLNVKHFQRVMGLNLLAIP